MRNERKQWISLIVLGVLSKCVLGQRYWSCDSECPLKCVDNPNDGVAVCSFIPDVIVIPVSFSSKCHFDCANKCYSQSLTVNNEGDCDIDDLTDSNEENTSPDPNNSSKRRRKRLTLLQRMDKTMGFYRKTIELRQRIKGESDNSNIYFH